MREFLGDLVEHCDERPVELADLREPPQCSEDEADEDGDQLRLQILEQRDIGAIFLRERREDGREDEVVLWQQHERGAARTYCATQRGCLRTARCIVGLTSRGAGGINWYSKMDLKTSGSCR
jgi:hypothetical protein